MEYIGNNYGVEVIQTSDLAGEVSAQCFCDEKTCSGHDCWNN